MKKLYIREILKYEESINKNILIDKIPMVLEELDYPNRKNWEKENAKKNGCEAFLYPLEIDGYNLIVSQFGSHLLKVGCKVKNKKTIQNGLSIYLAGTNFEIMDVNSSTYILKSESGRYITVYDINEFII